MTHVTFRPTNRSVEVQKGTSILKAAQMAGIIIESPCNGLGTCGKCKVKLDGESLNNIHYNSNGHLQEEEENHGIVLSCLAQVMDDISVSVKESGARENKTLDIPGHASAIDEELDGFIWKQFIEHENITRIYGGQNVLGIEQGNTTDKNYGVVVDIGTTTLVATIVDIYRGKEIESVCSLNPQYLHGQDVLSRITISSVEKGLFLMYSELIKEINRMIDRLTESSGIRSENIYEVVYSGNTCMLHLATRVSPYSLGKYPYTPQIFGGNHLNAAEHNLDISNFGILYLPPIISAYIGADITSGILASRLHNQKGTVFFVDIGTNGEIVIAHKGRLSATSAAAGPAFEGMNITYGMRAEKGAVEHFKIEKNGCITTTTIGHSKAVGLCGSGLVDIVGELVVHEVIQQNGKFADPRTNFLQPALKERLVQHKGKPGFKVSDGVYLSQKDIRQAQLAKGAVRAGVEVLLQHRGISASNVDKVFIAGAFGYHLSAGSLINIGLLPREFEGKIEFIGNTSKSGGQAFLLNKAFRQEMKEVVGDIEVLELANFQDFEKVFIKCLSF